MEKMLNDYLEKIERYLKPLPVSERIDIVKEIKSEIIELQNSGKTVEEIIERMGNPKDLAKAYLSDVISKSNSFSWNRILAICAYYSIASLSGIIVIPVLVICAPVFIITGIFTGIIGIIKLINDLFNIGIPYADNIYIMGIENPIIAFILTIIVGSVLYIIGRGCWKLLTYYIKIVTKTKQSLSL